MTHYQSVFNGSKMVYRKVVPQNGGKSGKSGGTVVPQETIEVKPAPKEDVKARRLRVGADLIKMLSQG